MMTLYTVGYIVHDSDTKSDYVAPTMRDERTIVLKESRGRAHANQLTD